MPGASQQLLIPRPRGFSTAAPQLIAKTSRKDYEQGNLLKKTEDVIPEQPIEKPSSWSDPTTDPGHSIMNIDDSLQYSLPD